ncbi:MAG TPA: hypothetical protein VL401_02735 [Alphaproteobacteria bacterium]|jgi:hypothetical protein|nr:hypothetical protein [Alphaproteobacteria bacterium]
MSADRPGVFSPQEEVGNENIFVNIFGHVGRLLGQIGKGEEVRLIGNDPSKGYVEVKTKDDSATSSTLIPRDLFDNIFKRKI